MTKNLIYLRTTNHTRMNWDAIGAIAACISALGVGIAAFEISSAKRQAQKEFEDDMAREYREIVALLPIEALLSKELSEEIVRANLLDFYRYIDLSNEQVFLHKQRRVSATTWKYWSDGIRGNFKRPAFLKAWLLIEEEGLGDFAELREFLKQN